MDSNFRTRSFVLPAFATLGRTAHINGRCIFRSEILLVVSECVSQAGVRRKSSRADLMIMRLLTTTTLMSWIRMTIRPTPDSLTKQLRS